MMNRDDGDDDGREMMVMMMMMMTMEDQVTQRNLTLYCAARRHLLCSASYVYQVYFIYTLLYNNNIIYHACSYFYIVH